MAGHQDRWDAFQKERGVGFPPLHDPTVMTTPLQSGLRIRQEGNSRDFMNSRMWDSFRATPPTQVSSDMLRTKNGPVHMDMNPEGSRKNTQQFRHQVEYMANELPPKENSTNPYLQRMDAAGSDARNIGRELRGAVVEDNRQRDIDSSKRLAERQFTDRWLPPKAAADAGSLEAYELLRPKQYSDM
jgi:hypothetical protein